jgi:carbamoyl-phosphate synthase/aspartate carbamoyltransferase/dihydroorotase
MTTLRLPPLIDVHVHMREPGGEHKETWDTGTAAALAGGITTVLAMPNTNPAVTDADTLAVAKQAAGHGARCDWAHYVGASLDNAGTVARLAPRAAGIKLYLDQTFGDLRLDDQEAWAVHLEQWPEDSVLVAHAEGGTLDSLLRLADWAERPVHIAHVATAHDIGLIADAKEQGQPVTCEVTPHHLFLDETNAPPGSWAEVRPRLGTPADRRALWDRLEHIDCFATDHAPHTVVEKAGDDAPPGFPGVEQMLPLLLTAVHDGLLDLDDVVERLSANPFRIWGLEPPVDTWVEVDPDEAWEIEPGQTKAGWSPFEGLPARGRVTKVVLRGATAFAHDEVVADPGSGRDQRPGDTT